MFYVILTGDEAPTRARPFQTQQQAEHYAMTVHSAYGPLVVQPSTRSWERQSAAPDYITRAALGLEFFQRFEGQRREEGRPARVAAGDGLELVEVGQPRLHAIAAS